MFVKCNKTMFTEVGVALVAVRVWKVGDSMKF